jgi:hypothetical protein
MLTRVRGLNFVFRAPAPSVLHDGGGRSFAIRVGELAPINQVLLGELASINLVLLGELASIKLVLLGELASMNPVLLGELSLIGVQ